MIKKVFLSIAFLLNFIAYSQDAVLKIVAKETCSCIEEKKSKSGDLAGEDLKTTLGMCMIKSYTDHISEFKTKIEFGDNAGMTNLGKDVALKMLDFCPNILVELGKLKDKPEEVEVEDEDIFVSGEVIDIITDQFIILQIKDKNGRNYTFLLLDYFDTASLLTNNEIKKKDKLNVGYTEIELFDSKAKEFRAYKILRKLEKQ